ncbi:MAG: MBL fold metallo-hydrolase [Bacteroidetes bacterium]|nr:MBL fold metallo-hydrolase [Bacteroidota bacterium]
MKLQFIGTGSGKTSLKRYHSSILITGTKHTLLIDAGDGISRALLSQEINPNSIDSILFTHYHADHFGGIASLITQMKLSGRTNSLSIFTHNKLINPLKNYLNSCYLFDERLGFELMINGFNAEEQIIVSQEINFTARENSHIQPGTISKNYPSINFISCSFYFELLNANSEIENKKIIYTSDIGSEKDLYLFKDKSADYFITETTHVGMNEIYNFYKTTNQKKLFLTHIDDNSEYEISRFLSNLDSSELNNILMVYDEFYISC